MKKLLTLLTAVTGIALFTVSCEKKIDVPDYGSIQGIVLDDSTNLPVAGVQITTTPASGSFLTDSDGVFILEKVPVGETSVKAEKKGYKVRSVAVNVVADDTVSVSMLITLDDDDNTVSPGGDFSDPTPNDGDTEIGVDTTLSWQYSDSTNKDVTYDLYLYAANAPAQKKVLEDTTDMAYRVKDLSYSTTYFWYVIAKEDDQKVAISDVWSFTTVDQPDNRLVYARQSSGSYEVYSAGLDGSTPLKLTSSPARDWNPALSPLITKVAFTSDRSSGYNIYHTNRDGSLLTKVTTLPVTGYHNDGLGYCWSPNGGGFAYSHYDKIYYIDKEGLNFSSIIDTAPQGKNWRELDWNGPSQKIVAQAVGVNIYESEIYIMDANGNNAQLIVGDTVGRTDHPVFSPDGSKILYTHDAQGFNSVNGRQLDARIYLLDLTTMKQTDLSQGKTAGTNDLMPEFSANGAEVIFMNEDNTGGGVPEIWKMAIDGSNRQLILSDGTMPHVR